MLEHESTLVNCIDPQNLKERDEKEAETLMAFVSEYPGIPQAYRDEIQGLFGNHTTRNIAVIESRKIVKRLILEEMLLNGSPRNEIYSFNFAPYDYFTGRHHELPVLTVSSPSYYVRTFYPSEFIRREFIERKLWHEPSERIPKKV